jgi:hypothetical protein
MCLITPAGIDKIFKGIKPITADKFLGSKVKEKSLSIHIA